MKSGAPTRPTDQAAQSRQRGVSIRLLAAILFLTAALAVVFSLVELRETTKHAQGLYGLEQERQRCDAAIQAFMDGSDYLTTQVQQFAVSGDRAHMDSYWREVTVTKHRDAALEQIIHSNVTPEEYRRALASKDESDSLILGETWAMRILSESLGVAEADMPAEVAAFKLSENDAALSNEEKHAAALAYVFGPEYSAAKDSIRGNVTAFRNEIADRYGREAIAALESTKNTSRRIAFSILIFCVFLIGAAVCVADQIISPLVRFSRALSGHEAGRPIALKESGALEIKQFAKAFNDLYAQVEQNTKRLERLGYVDYLTNVPNRASVTEYVERTIVDGRHRLGLLIVDIDNFKRFNDTYGHALGDKVLIAVAKAVCSVQPPENGISGRICGEEFVVVSRNATEETLSALAEKILENVRAISAADVTMPDVEGFGVTVSIGGMLWNGEMPASFIMLLSKADQALYVSKQTGKDKYTKLA